VAKLQKEKEIEDSLNKAYWALSDMSKVRMENQGKQVWTVRQQNEIAAFPDAISHLRDALALLFNELRESK
jgi:hypothetical protein